MLTLDKTELCKRIVKYYEHICIKTSITQNSFMNTIIYAHAYLVVNYYKPYVMALVLF